MKSPYSHYNEETEEKHKIIYSLTGNEKKTQGTGAHQKKLKIRQQKTIKHCKKSRDTIDEIIYSHGLKESV